MTTVLKKTMLLTFGFLTLCTSISSALADYSFGNCHILRPGARDFQRRWCAPGTFGIVYGVGGPMIDGRCHNSFNGAMRVMESSLACRTYSLNFGSCRVLYPTARDRNNRSCGVNRYGIVRHEVLQNCYSTMDEALSIMQTINECRY